MRLAVYRRVSSGGQMDGWGPDDQLAACRKWARHVGGHSLIELPPEVFTGKVEDRPILGDAIRLIKRRDVDGLLIPRLDRIARQFTVQEAILAMVWSLGGRVFAADQGEILQDDPDDPMRTAMRQMQGVFAQLDRAMLSKRMHDGRRAKAASGRKATGQYPFGYMPTGAGRERDAGPDPDTQPVVQMILDLREMHASYRQICQRLTEAGHPPKRGPRWLPMTVKRIYERERRSDGR